MYRNIIGEIISLRSYPAKRLPTGIGRGVFPSAVVPPEGLPPRPITNYHSSQPFREVIHNSRG